MQGCFISTMQSMHIDEGVAHCMLMLIASSCTLLPQAYTQPWVPHVHVLLEPV